MTQLTTYKPSQQNDFLAAIGRNAAFDKITTSIMRLSVDHRTEYHYEKPVSFGDHHLYLRPRESKTLRVESFQFESEPAGKIRWIHDAFSNVVAVANFGLDQTDKLIFRNTVVFTVDEDNPFNFILDPRATGYPFKYDERERSALAPYLNDAVPAGSGKALDWFYMAVKEPNQSTDIVGWLLDINQAIKRDISYVVRDDEGIQSTAQTLELRSGSCRDMAQLFISVCRQLGIAARFASGYLYVPPSGDDAQAFVGNNNAMHAWAEVFLPGAGWLGFDPTNGILTNHYYLTAAVSNRAEWVNPIQGKYFHDEQVASTMQVSLQMQELN
ncbi:transglutaminase family protein [Rubellicoccus peritrichatus]|uniref:Transglutaminase family protein n=1 Tax=Rubellicoccus peritrichatus TaxID=3080537 RepID=A0AAQ3LF22_9BACT|nr:transglutaminase family protein [Puniceicoccus sp. CR14]WOO42493.1 transglutaminase family protein [Puniceicoccus sp. CR14]